MKMKAYVLRLFLLTAVIAVAALADDMEDDNLDVGDMEDEEFEDTDPDMMDPGMMPDMDDDGSVMDDMDLSDDATEEEEPKVNRVRVSFINIFWAIWCFCQVLCCFIVIVDCVLIVVSISGHKGSNTLIVRLAKKPSH